MSYLLADDDGILGDFATNAGLGELRERAGESLAVLLDEGEADAGMQTKIIAEVRDDPDLAYIAALLDGARGTVILSNGVIEDDEPEAEFAEAAAGDPDAADAFAERLDAEARAAFEGLLEPVRRLVMGAGSLQEVKDGLLDLYPGMDTAAFAEVFARALTAADLAGRYEVTQEPISTAGAAGN